MQVDSQQQPKGILNSALLQEEGGKYNQECFQWKESQLS